MEYWSVDRKGYEDPTFLEKLHYSTTPVLHHSRIPSEVHPYCNWEKMRLIESSGQHQLLHNAEFTQHTPSLQILNRLGRYDVLGTDFCTVELCMTAPNTK